MNWLKKQALERPEQKFINRLTFAQVYDQVNELGQKLFPYVEKQSRVALYANNSEKTLLFFLALQGLEKEVLMLNTRLNGAEIGLQLDRLQTYQVFGEEAGVFPLAGKVFVPFHEVYEREPVDVVLAEEYRQEQIAVIMNTSATTGEFKSVPLRWKQFAAHVEASQKSLGVSGDDNWLMVLPVYHISGMTVLMRSLYNGTQITVMEKFQEKQVLELIEEGRINMVSLVPTMLNRMIDQIRSHRLRVVLLGGEFIPRPLVEKCLTKQIPIYKTYGMTETTSQSATFSVLAHPEKIDAVGQPLPSVEIMIDQPDQTGIGEVHIKSPMLMEGYLGREPEKHREFFNTEDIGYKDQDGFLYILDRRKNIIISGGENIYPKEIENVLYAHPQIAECAVVGQQDAYWGRVPVLFVVSALSAGEIRQYLTGKIAGYKMPKKIIYVEQLPRNASGKVQTNELEKWLVHDED